MSDKKPVCSTCNDTHLMFHSGLERDVMCTSCPTPCMRCRQGAGQPGVGLGPYCETTPCSCVCHSVNKIPPVVVDLGALQTQVVALSEEVLELKRRLNEARSVGDLYRKDYLGAVDGAAGLRKQTSELLARAVEKDKTERRHIETIAMLREAVRILDAVNNAGDDWSPTARRALEDSSYAKTTDSVPG